MVINGVITKVTGSIPVAGNGFFHTLEVLRRIIQSLKTEMITISYIIGFYGSIFHITIEMLDSENMDIGHRHIAVGTPLAFRL
jgi:hypothetical protein